jgi:uncharacterized protein YqhQ
MTERADSADPKIDAEPEVAADATDCRRGHTFGGQAVIEGVMMRGRHSWGVAVRRPSGGIARKSYPLPPAGSRHRLLKWPVIRGVVALYESMSLGIKALGISANIGLESAGEGESNDGEAATVSPTAVESALLGGVGTPVPEPEMPEEPPAFGWKQLAVTVSVAVGMAVALFIVVPLVVVKQFEETFANPFLFNFVEGVIRIAIFLLYIVGISLIPDLRRVFMYHGAEHKVIHAYESCGRADAEYAKRFPTLHPRCGTGFLLLVMVISVFVFAFVGKPSLPWLVFSRIVGIPLIIGLAYEIGIKWAGTHADGVFARILLWPGIQLQRLTTREPTPDQLEVAAAALEEVMLADATEADIDEPSLVMA